MFFYIPVLLRNRSTPVASVSIARMGVNSKLFWLFSFDWVTLTRGLTTRGTGLPPVTRGRTDHFWIPPPVDPPPEEADAQ